MSDAARMNSDGERTLQSIQYKAVLITKDPISKVIAYYKAKLKSEPSSIPAQPGPGEVPDSGRSVTFQDDSQQRPVAIHVICVNTERASTTLVISRAATESQTHIAWARYQKL